MPIRLRERYEEEIYRHYLTNGIQLITENTARSSKGKYLSQKYDEIIHPKKQVTGDEVVEDIITKLGLNNGIT